MTMSSASLERGKRRTFCKRWHVWRSGAFTGLNGKAEERKSVAVNLQGGEAGRKNIVDSPVICHFLLFCVHSKYVRVFKY